MARFQYTRHSYLLRILLLIAVNTPNAIFSQQFKSKLGHTPQKGAFMVVLSTWFCILMARKSINIRFVSSFSGAENSAMAASFAYTCIYANESQTSIGKYSLVSMVKYKSNHSFSKIGLAITVCSMAARL